MAKEMKMVNLKVLAKEVRLWKREALKRYMSLSKFILMSVREELRRTRSSPEPEPTPQDTASGRRG